MNYLYFFIKQYRDDELECQKLYSNPDMFFEIWKEAFISKMEEERKKKKDQMKERDKIRKKMQAQNQRGEIKPEKIKPLAVYNIYFYRYHFHFSKINQK